MRVKIFSINELVESLGDAIVAGDVRQAFGLFTPDGWFRDMLVTTWEFQNVPTAGLKDFFHEHGLPNVQGLVIDPKLPVKRTQLPMEGRENFLVAFLRFSVTSVGAGRGYLRAVSDAEGNLRIFTLLLALDNLFSHPQSTGPRLPLGVVHSSIEKRLNWLDQRKIQRDFQIEPPVVLIVGSGHSGLMLAARLTMAGVSCLIVERSVRIGDSWRKRYQTLRTHVPSWGDHFPYLPFPPNWPLFTPKDKLANWLEFYAEAMELNVWTSCNILPGAVYDDIKQTWSVPVAKADGTQRVLHPRHVVQATGHSGEPRIPFFPGKNLFKGDIMHSSEFDDGARWAGKRAIIVGSGNSGHDIAQDLFENGAAEVTMVQRSSTVVNSATAIAEYYFKPLFADDDLHYEDGDLASISAPFPLQEKIWTGMQPALDAMDAGIHKGLEASGFKLNKHRAGLYSLFYKTGGGHYLDVGCSQLIADGKIKIKQGIEVSKFMPDGVEFEDGTQVAADLVVLATGWNTMNTTCEKIFGPEIAGKTGTVWGVDDEGNVRGIWRDSGHPRFWFMGGSLQLARTYSRYLALQIMATEAGIMPVNQGQRRECTIGNEVPHTET